MSSLTVSQMREIDRAKELLVPAAEKLLNEANVLAIDPRQFGHSQLRNLIAVAIETESPAVVANFIRYQMGRDNRGNGWSKVHAGKPLGERFLDEIEKQGGTIDLALAKVSGLEGDGATKQIARIELTRHFLGFASRYLKFLDLKPERQRRGGH